MDTGQAGPVPVTDIEGSASSQTAIRLAVVDSDSGFVRVFAKRVGAVGWRAELLATAPSADELLSMRLHAIVIDPALLGREAWSYIERLGSHPAAPAIVVCTGQSSVAQRVRGLRLGADDWVTKPCHPEEVLARVEAAVRRRQVAISSAKAQEPVVAGELEVRPDMFEAFVGGRAIGLTRREFELVHLLAEQAGRVIPRERIYERVWGYAMAHGDRSVDVFVRKLRKKLEAASPGWRYLHTHFGVGYRFDPEPRAEDNQGTNTEATVEELPEVEQEQG